MDDRLRSADGAYKALHEILVRCGKAGEKACEFAKGGDPVKKFATLAERLRKKPAIIDENGLKVTVTYADLIGATLRTLYEQDGWSQLGGFFESLYAATAPAGEVPAAEAAAAKRAIAQRVHKLRAQHRRPSAKSFSYNNSTDAFSSVICTDGRHPKRAESWPAATAKSDRRAPYFGRAWAWSSVQCAGNAWTVRDRGAYTGPFNRRTSAPVLFVGNYYDPATNYDQAVSSSKLLPNSGLLSSDSWGHTAYGSSKCVTDAMDQYLLNVTMPKKGTVCVGDEQPFPDKGITAKTPGSAKRSPVYVPRIPSVLLGTR
jgi:hypothetical protein